MNDAELLLIKNPRHSATQFYFSQFLHDVVLRLDPDAIHHNSPLGFKSVRKSHPRTESLKEFAVMEILPKSFDDRDALIAHVKSLWLDAGGDADGAEDTSPMEATPSALAARLDAVDPQGYSRSRNFLNGKITKLSPYIRHGMVSLNHVRNLALDRAGRKEDAEKLIQELAWRDYWQLVRRDYPNWIWEDAEAYKTGFTARDYADALPDDIAKGETGVAAIDDIIAMLKSTGYLHNHLRMYLASYICHWRRVKWQAGAKFMLNHLIDADAASNNLSWQWIASTYSRKPYIFNLENMQKYCGDNINTISRHNIPLDAGYDVLTARLFPQMDEVA